MGINYGMLIAPILWIVSVLLSYYIIKWAIKNAIRELKEEMKWTI